jgi:hypothetical protein
MYYSQSATKISAIFNFFFLTCRLTALHHLFQNGEMDKLQVSSGSACENKILKIAEVFVVDWLQYGITL